MPQIAIYELSWKGQSSKVHYAKIQQKKCAFYVINLTQIFQQHLAAEMQKST